MGETSLLELNVKKIILNVERLIGIGIPRNVIEISILPKEQILYVRFSEPKNSELGEPIHPLIHIFRDERTKEITAMEIINFQKFVKES